MTQPWIHHGALEELLALGNSGPGPPSVCVVSGGPGSGRTSLVRRFTEQVDLPVLWVDGGTYARSGHLDSAVDLAHSGLLPFLELTRPEELERILADPATADPHQVARDLWLVAQAYGDLERPRVCVVDDFDLLDLGSQEVVAYLLRRVSQLSTRVVLVTGASHVPAPLHGIPVVELRPLEVDQARALIESLIDEPVPYRVAEQIRRSTAGVPLAIASVVRRLTSSQLAGLDLLPHPLPLSEVSARRLLPRAGLSVGQRRLLAALAVEESLGVDEALVVLAGDSIDDAVAEGVVHSVNHVIAPVSPAQALAVWTATAELERLAIHRLLASATPDTGCERLHRALGGEDVGAHEVAESALAAYHSGELTHVALAVQLMGRALPKGSLPLAAMLFSDGYVETVRAVIEVSAGRPGHLDADDVAWLQAQVAMLTGLVSDSIPRVVAEPPPDEERRRAWAGSVFALVRAQVQRGDLDGAARTMQQAAVGLGAEIPDLQALAEVVRAEIALKRREDWAPAGLAEAARRWVALKPPGYEVNSSVVAFILLSVSPRWPPPSSRRRSHPRQKGAWRGSGTWPAGSMWRWLDVTTAQPSPCCAASIECCPTRRPGPRTCGRHRCRSTPCSARATRANA
ncbi:hypothetical protein BN12_60008 [Nostocoides japonicum T1-X7]|uniref:Orc1-like AAA ATPase domain-containing protein n=1 Tax=Nostocoides japonicum T1-X7 TaxID=1194083 RepID=A0A077M405_9MICO|nr:AAA family ATPase [Tetrasphaera japonica]CCH79802.1 hypothetical protein BN12_60008 [Tetrasphaera japonica T1-X7]